MHTPAVGYKKGTVLVHTVAFLMEKEREYNIYMEFISKYIYLYIYIYTHIQHPNTQIF